MAVGGLVPFLVFHAYGGLVNGNGNGRVQVTVKTVVVRVTAVKRKPETTRKAGVIEGL
jgi:hypothetical protein